MIVTTVCMTVFVQEFKFKIQIYYIQCQRGYEGNPQACMHLV